jgi:hypothetical protein
MLVLSKPVIIFTICINHYFSFFFRLVLCFDRS